jgi:hypothetical protein
MRANRGYDRRPVTRRNPARFLVPLALVAVTIVVIVVIANSGFGGGGSSSDDSAASERQQRQEQRERRRQRRQARRKTYTVQPGDSLSIIAEKTSVPVEELQALNPDLDPQALTPGQKIKLRE